ncbi:GroES-like protein [Fomitopsis serialis]|uniref:GroES-like protein n=1 Tax=Fomitopsis serialis TaxID=139415 RepID=UPI002007F5F9|nr:GroES-like protein [Neoantrodia serialis]XP_047886944.1 GroES-like protein [Neoantrodia serialis]KAH9912117.1 GroES-like protein [Neoantrodia serialis]KAH9915089.1 GroES-like protein [Neoantrodia serialis]
MVEFKGYALTKADRAAWNSLEVVEFEPKKFEDTDVEFAITHCGLCGSDVHILRQGWGDVAYTPLVVGHEIVGKVVRVGPKVTEFKAGDRVGVGAKVGSCGTCNRCTHDNEQYCTASVSAVVLRVPQNSRFPDGTPVQGGFATAIRVDERFVFAIPEGIESKDAASMLCGGVTVFSPLRRNHIGPGTKVGVIGIGGLGHYAILFAKALGAKVYAFTHSPNKQEDAKKLGADVVVDTGVEDYQKPYFDTLDLIISTTNVFPKGVTYFTYTSMLTPCGKFVNVGLPDADKDMPSLQASDILWNGTFVGGSLVGSKRDVNEMLKVAAEKGVKPWVQELPMREYKTALEGVHNGDVRYRYVLKQDLVPVE